MADDKKVMSQNQGNQEPGTSQNNVSNSISDNKNELVKRLEQFVTAFVTKFEVAIQEYHNQSEVGKTDESFTEHGKIVGAVLNIPAGPEIGEILGRSLGKFSGERIKAKKIMEIFREVEKYELRKILVYVAGDIFLCFQNQFNKITDTKGSSARGMQKLAKDALDRTMNYIHKQTRKPSDLSELLTRGIILGNSKMSIGASFVHFSKINKICSKNFVPIFFRNSFPQSGHTIKHQEPKHEPNAVEWKTSSLYENVGIVNIFSGGKHLYYTKKGCEIEVREFGYRLPFSWETLEEYELNNSKPQTSYDFILTEDELKKQLDIILNRINCEDIDYYVKITKEDTTNILKILSDCKEKGNNINELNKINTIIEINNIDDKINLIDSKIDKLIPENNESLICIAKNTQMDINNLKIQVENLIPKTSENKRKVWFDIIAPVKSFTGRNSVLKSLHEALQKEKGQAVVSQATSIIGLGGIGKSELARKYAFDYCENYDNNIIWINAETKQSLKESFFRLAKELNISVTEIISRDKTEQEIDIKSIAKEVYKSFVDVKSLFIFDNAEGFDDINEFLPFILFPYDKKPNVLVTSRNQEWDIGDQGTVELIELSDFTSEEALDFIKNTLKIEDNSRDDEIKYLASEQQYFPLALGQSTSYINKRNKELKKLGNKTFEITDYLKEYKEENKKKLLDFKTKHDRYIGTVLTTWKVTLKKIEENRNALKIIQIMAYLAPDFIDIKLIFAELVKDETKLLKAFDLLCQYSMVNVKNGIANIHRLVQEVIRLELKEMRKEVKVLISSIQLLGNVLNDIGTQEINNSHIISVWIHACDYDKLIKKYFFKLTYFNNKSTPLHVFSRNIGNIETVEKILNYMEKNVPKKIKKIINAKNDYGQTPCKIAVENNNLAIVEILKNLDAEIDTESCVKATFSGYVDIVRILDPNNNKYLFHAELYLAIKDDNVFYVENILKGLNKDQLEIIMEPQFSDVKPCLVDYLYPFPLYMATKNGNLDIVKLLIKYNADINYTTKNMFGKTTICAAVYFGHLEIVKLLVESGVNTKKVDKLGQTILHIAAEYNQLEIVKYIINKNLIDLDVMNKERCTPLHCAAVKGHLDIVRILIEKGANSKLADHHNRTLLHYASQSDLLEIVKYLVNSNIIDVNIPDKEASTPLHFAAFYGKLNVVKFLLGNEIRIKANLNSIGEFGVTPIISAMLNFNCEIVEFLLNQEYININAIITIPYYKPQNQNLNFSVLTIAVAYDQIEIVKKLIEKYGINIIYCYIHKNLTAIHVAAYFNCTNVIQYFIEKGITFDGKFNAIIKVSKEKGNKPPINVSYFSIFARLLYLSYKLSELFDT